MNKWGIVIAILGTATVGLLGFLVVQIWTQLPAPVASPIDHAAASKLEQRRLELESERLAVEALRLKAEIQDGLVRAGASLETSPIEAAKREALMDAMVALAEDRQTAEPSVGVAATAAAVPPAISVDPPPAAQQAFVPDPVAFEQFYEPLQPYGDWFESDDYGPIWQPGPSYVDSGWAPYSNGSWGYSDYGWTWASDEPFSWACDHFGRWLRVYDRGWCWVPGRDWAPAWVSWRSCDTHIGWAPLPPCATWRPSLGIGGWVDAHCGIGPGHYHFVPRTEFGARDCRRVIVDHSHNLQLVAKSRNITRLHLENRCIHNIGPALDEVRRDSRHDIERRQIDAAAEAQRPQRHLAGNARGQAARPALRDLGAGVTPDRGWDGVRDRADQLHLRRQVLAEARGALVDAEEPDRADARRAPERGRGLTAITPRAQPVERKSTAKLPPQPVVAVQAIQAAPSRDRQQPSPPPSSVAERELPDHFAAEQARRDETLARQQAELAERQRQIAERTGREREARQALEQQIREREERAAAIARAEQAQRQRARSVPAAPASTTVARSTGRGTDRSTPAATDPQRHDRAVESAQRTAAEALQRQQLEQQRQRESADLAARSQREQRQQQAAAESQRRAQLENQRQVAASNARRDAERREAAGRQQQQARAAAEDQQRRAAADAAARVARERRQPSQPQKQAQPLQPQRQPPSEQGRQQPKSRSAQEDMKRGRSR